MLNKKLNKTLNQNLNQNNKFDRNNFELNKEGYLIRFETWNKDFANDMADSNGLKLTECHWQIINFFRDYYLEYGIAPEPREVIIKLGEKINPHMPCSKKHLEGLFADGGCKLACKIAGLPVCPCRGV